MRGRKQRERESKEEVKEIVGRGWRERQGEREKGVRKRKRDRGRRGDCECT